MLFVEIQKELQEKKSSKLQNPDTFDYRTDLKLPVTLICPACRRQVSANAAKVTCKDCQCQFSFDFRIPKIWESPFAIECPSCKRDVILYRQTESVLCFSCNNKFSIEKTLFDSGEVRRVSSLAELEELECRFCKKCFPRKFTYCQGCGKPLDPVRACKKCDAELQEGDKICPKCGRQQFLKEESSLFNLFGMLSPQLDAAVYFDRKEYTLRMKAKYPATSKGWGCCVLLMYLSAMTSLLTFAILYTRN